MGGRNSTHYHQHNHYHIADAQEHSSGYSCLPVYNSPSNTSPAPSFRSPNYKMIRDEFDSLEQVTQALAQAGLESSNLIIGIDFTRSNEWTGQKSFKGKNLHHLGELNPYEQAISIIGRTLACFDEDNRIPCYGFGDVTTGDQQVFSFHLGDGPCHGFEEVLSCYRERVPHVKLAGPTSFAPIIRNAIRIVNDSGGQYHVLMIIADGQVTRSVDTPDGQLSPQEESTIDALVEASKYPLSIVLVGVGDGPWDLMHECDDHIPARDFDNFQFVNFTEIMLKNIPASKMERVCIEISYGNTITIQSNNKPPTFGVTYNRQRETRRQFPFPLPPPISNISLNSSPSYRRANSNRQIPAFGFAPSPPSEYSSSSLSSSSSFNRICPVCFLNDRDLALGCGHKICSDCGKELIFCPTCQTQITIKVRLLE